MRILNVGQSLARTTSLYYSASVVYKTSGYNSNGYYCEKSRVEGRGNSRKKARRKTVQKPAKTKAVAALARLGVTEKVVLKIIEEFERESGEGYRDVASAYLFMVADIVDYLVRRFGRRFGLNNEGYRLSKAIHKAVKRLVNRGIVDKKDRGVYALRRDLARLLVGGFSLVNEPIEVLVEKFASSFVRNYVEKVVERVVEDTVFSPSKAGENLWGRAGVLDAGLTKVQYNGGDGGWGVLRFHVVGARSMLDVFDAEVFLLYWLGLSVRDDIRFFASLYGVSFVRRRVSAIRRLVYEAYERARVVRGCHGRYNDSPGDFSPLSPDCQGHHYEYGSDSFIPASLARAIRSVVRHAKFYVRDSVPKLPNSLPITSFLGDGDGRGSIIGL